ncbi:MAG: response regulator transcription factor [Bacteroidota bacterium]|jgi:two-component system response regulator NreC|nr:response regulator transcription factor [Ignavibacteria bacterium]MCU7499681.1 response regulator transcription factor [Ignavibacteria bacterium]MCU7511991.1 response regulator transcription factor [Ignavibacteria bacterium]MCU7521309.1 response regulator transcription factor [Ignavibacteria bacterium]MCU7524758.1 response regulator transcription factor [Ignavibacteria bacterium]
MPNPNSIRIVVADDHSLFRSGIISLLEDAAEIFVVGEATDGGDLYEKYFELKPDVILVDISMPGVTGIEALKKILARDPSAKALFLSMHEGEEYVYHILKSGGKGLISKNVMKGELVYAIKTVYSGKKYFGAYWTEERLEELREKYSGGDGGGISVQLAEASLTQREIEILRLIGEGYTSNEIASKTGLSKRTVDTHRIHLMSKLGIKSLPELIKYAIQYMIQHRD